MNIFKVLSNPHYLRNLIKIKFDIFPPKKADILVYDYETVTGLYPDILFKKKSKEFFYNRFERLNLFILFKSLIIFKFLNVKKNYIFHFFNYVKPKIVYTSIDNNPAFYLLKHIYPKSVYIADQNGTRNNLFYNYCFNQIKKHNIKYVCDYYFVFGELEKKRLKKIISGKIICAGNTKNNSYEMKKKKKKKIITYISSKIKLRPELEKRIFEKLIKFSKKFKYNLFFLDRPGQNNRKILKDIFKDDNWNYLQIKSESLKIKFLNQSKLITFAHSTLGYQLLSRGLKCVAFNHNYYNYSNLFKISKNGEFWCSPDKYNLVEKKLLEVIRNRDTKWKKIVKTKVSKIMFYDKNNKFKKKIINKIFNE